MVFKVVRVNAGLSQHVYVLVCVHLLPKWLILQAADFLVTQRT